MSRYIDREAVRRAIQEYCHSSKEITPDGIAKVVMSVPTADVVSVVRCRDCKYFEMDDDGFTYCVASTGLDSKMQIDYCSYGERKEECKI